ncbi:MAG TPA: TonB-dependent receptor [Thermoanaerobaculia bacterium]|nr:TonB-dependent receptor [Thermoanaerobaculia bacterium]
MTTAVLLVLLGALTRLVPHPPNFVPLGAIALYAGARLPRGLAWAVPLGAMALSDFFVDFGSGRAAIGPVRVAVYASFIAIVLLGRFARGPIRAGRLAALSVAASSLFFVASNFGEWIRDPLYQRTAAGLLLCYAAAIPFFWATLAADLLGTAALFSLDALSRRQLLRGGLPVGLAVALVLLPGALAAQQVPPAEESVVVTATSVPEQEKEVGSAVTVITREQIEKSETPVVADLLRQVPGLDVVTLGSPGSQTSLFTRGTNSTQTLVLVDGARMNSPFFAGYDWSAVTTENVDRIEVVRGPFSALYGSDAIGGVVQIFTHSPDNGFSGRATGEAGNQGQGRGSASFSLGEGMLGATGSYSYSAFDGDRPNTDWRERNGSARVEARLAPGSRIAIEGSILDGEVGNPGAVGSPFASPTARGFFREERVGVPASFALSDTNQLDVLLASVRSKPGFADVGFESQTDAQTYQTRVADTAKLGNHQLTGFVSWERWKVDDGSNFGPNITDGRTTIYGLGAQDAVTLGAFTVTGGLRYDHHSEFGSAWSPRGTISWLSSDGLWKLRASGGTGFRAPTVGELFYPFSGNPDLQPEKSVSAELGAERYIGTGRAEVSLFWNDLKDLIVYDFATQLNENVGHARTRGVEVGWRQPVGAQVFVDASYTYLHSEDLATSEPLLRRPRHRASLGVDWRPIPALDLYPRIMYVGTRDDVSEVSGPVTDPAYVRVDLTGRWQAWRFAAPYVRVSNAFNHQYEEAAGYPAPGILVAGGLDVKF